MAGVALYERNGNRLTVATQVQFLLASDAWDQRLLELRAHYASLVDAIVAAADKTALDAVNIATGWPAV